MAQGWHGDSAGHARAGQIGGRKSAESRRARAQAFGERIAQQEKARQHTKRKAAAVEPSGKSPG